MAVFTYDSMPRYIDYYCMGKDGCHNILHLHVFLLSSILLPTVVLLWYGQLLLLQHHSAAYLSNILLQNWPRLPCLVDTGLTHSTRLHTLS